MTVSLLERRRGITRTVILTRRWAIKVPSLRAYGEGPTGVLRSWCRGVLANQSEREWSEVDGVNPVVWSLWSIVNVYRRALPAAEPIDYDVIGPDFLPSGDRKPDNVGLVDGRLVWIDYDASWNGPRCRTCAPPGSVPADQHP